MISAARATALAAWYEPGRRGLPWRGRTDPYEVLVAEVMLQQTQASRVAARYEEFLGRFPTAAALAAAPLADVLGAWSGLGYNSRARRLREAAAMVVEQGWPRTVAGLRALPGVGPYTAAAVACFAFGADVAAPDTNARRVLSRWGGQPLSGKALGDEAAAGLAAWPGSAGGWNQAVMDLGATVCLPRSPRCGECPVAEWCAGPAAYVPPRPQGRFAGSTRQVRGALLRELLAGEPAGAAALADAVGFPARRVEAALASLAAEGMVEEGAAGWRLAG